MSRRPSSGSVGLADSPELTRHNGHTTWGTSKRDPAHLGDAARRPAVRNASSSQRPDNSMNLNDIDPDELFTRHTIPEIKMVQHRLRAEADAKQEELRLMVGERYRDLLQASTSILGLAKSSQHVLEALEEMRETVNAITPSRAPKRTAAGEDKHLQALQSLSAHVKLLLDAPEHLWRLMERKAYLNAAWLLLLARVVHRALSQDDDDQSWHAFGIDVAEQLPLVQRQWDSITPFRSQISHRATLFLREVSSTPGEVCATLLTLHLLEFRPIPETLSIYLAQRTKTLSSLLARKASTSANGNAVDAKPNGKAPHRPRKVVVREAKQSAEAALDAISRTLGTARLIFSDAPSGEPALMRAALHFFQAPSDSPVHLPPELRLSTQILLSSLPSSSHFLLLPQNIRAYRPYVDGASLETPSLQTQLREKLDIWSKRALQELRDALADWLAPLEYIREVWEVRSALLQWLKDVDSLDTSERQELHSAIDAASLSQAATVWKVALGRLESSFREAVTAAADALTENAKQHQLDTQPVQHLFQAPSIPSGLQAGSHSASAAASQFSRYQASLRQQLGGRTPLVETALAALETHATQIQGDIDAIHRSSEHNSVLLQQLSTSYRADAEMAAEHICEVLETTASREAVPLRVSVHIARLSQDLGSTSAFFSQIGCGEAASERFRGRLDTLAINLVQRWRERTVSRIIDDHLSGLVSETRRFPKDDAHLPTRPSSNLMQALMSLATEMQQLGVCLNDERRRLQVGSTLTHFVVSFIDRLEQSPMHRHAGGPQLLWDLSFLRGLARLWETSADLAVQRIDASIPGLRQHLDGEVQPQSDIAASTHEYLTKTQVLLAPLLPSRPFSPSKVTKGAEKSSRLLLFGTPAVEQGFEPALQLVKTPPRFGLLLVGGAASK
ncbi:hypothetical protein BV20DRAFT_960271 [Pilatotrama ljubarskyi]|nr:hypothetical protein BV20DRAFT_960271 [Pilatotrama ljubarskyi]